MKQFLKLAVGFFAFCIVLVGFIWMFAPKSVKPALDRPTVADATTVNSAVTSSQQDHRSDKPAQDSQHNGH